MEKELNLDAVLRKQFIDRRKHEAELADREYSSSLSYLERYMKMAQEEYDKLKVSMAKRWGLKEKDLDAYLDDKITLEELVARNSVTILNKKNIKVSV